ncbi:RTC4-like domain-containing protein [Diplogelasinospora grovesii]|uniref:Restriction of telomere capping protein 4 n=1 Tax=Diplogelasinospora grovesii TaxID=303347 RepID=A0AAN6NDF1_9PEZI|nr:RTC4-like domain-containing protein [Diplogelasinospora grovesii]
MTWNSRRVGLSTRARVEPLLSSFPRKEGKLKDVPVDAPPLSSDEYSSDDGLPERGHIQPTKFGKSNRQSNASDARNTRKSSSRVSIPAEDKTTQTSTPRDSVRSISPSSQNRKRTLEDNDDAQHSQPPKKPRKEAPKDEVMGRQFADDLFSGARRTSSVAKVRTYGKLPQNNIKPLPASSKGTKASPAGKRPLRIPRSVPRSPSRRKEELQHDQSPPTRLKAPKISPSAESVSPGRRRSLRVPQGSTGQRAELISPRRKLRGLREDREMSPANAAPRRKAMKKGRDGVKLTATEITPEQSQRPTLKIPEAYSPTFDMDLEEEPSQISALSRSLSPLTEIGSPSFEGAVCPVCNEAVDKDLFEDFKDKHPRMTFDQRQEFCHVHKKDSARQTWRDRGYPDIDWHGLESRIKKQHGFVRSLLEGGKSHYGDKFSEKVKTGKERTLLKSRDNLTPGYYGVRGLRAMSEILIREFASLLRERALKDRLVSARGHTAYVQFVLVPELTVQLIMEDMDVGEQEARSILEESKSVGELLNDEVADVVVNIHDDDDSSSTLTSLSGAEPVDLDGVL